ncbi:ATP-binding protein [Pedobacter sp. Hv1]|uniref:tetratricopeptide repeat-containing sensor histidine kinase n=1 Tax=Pedobacter sp. Hv1 TaxID=1740090 RepID=UPI000B0A7871|nr:ATP-binding protein [Pedobacter sp. Hv1]
MKRLNLLLLFLSICLWSCSKDQLKEQKKEPNPLYDRASAYKENGQVDSAFIYFNKAKDLALLQKDSLVVGQSLAGLAIFFTNTGDDPNGQEYSLNALSYLNEKKKQHYTALSSNYNNLGIATHNLRDYKNAHKYYDLAIKFSTTLADTNLYRNNKAYSYQETKQYKKALEIYDLILKTASKDMEEYPRVLSNISTTKWLLNPNYNPLPELLKAAHIREKENDLWGRNSSYYYLADYYGKSKPDSALYYAHQMYDVAKKLKSNDDQLLALQKLIKFSPAPLSKQYFETYLKLDDSALVIRNNAKNQFAIVRYDVEKHKAANFVLQQDNTEKKYQLIILITGTIVLLIAGLFWYRKRKQRLQLEAQNTIRENQLKTSKKVHDVVANGLYRVMTEIENQEDLNKDHILDKIEDMYEKSRDISYDQPSLTLQPFHEKVNEILSSFASENRVIQQLGNTAQLWKKVNTQIQYEVEHILQELMVNMKRHSQANLVILQFEQTTDHINIYYTDNGIGLSKDTLFKNGLTNTGNRIDHIHGTITFDTETEKGLKIKLSFPIS